MTRRLALAETLGCDVADVDYYQRGQHKPELFQAGDDIYAVLKGTECLSPRKPHPCSGWEVVPPVERAKPFFVFRRPVSP